MKKLRKIKEKSQKLTLHSISELTKQDTFYSQYQKLKSLDGINVLKIPSYEKPFPFKLKDFEPIDWIFVTERVIVEQYLHKPTNVVMAAKFVRIPFYRLETEFNEKVLKKWKNEINIYHALPSSPNLVTLYGYCVYGGFVITFMEYMDMSIQELYKRHYMLGLLLNDVLIGAIGVATINAIHSLKTKKILHRDIKPQNILINKKGEIKLCDFGVSKLMENSLASTVTGTIPYWPPEYFKYDDLNPLRYNTQPDVWSLGVTLAEIGCPSWPFIDVGEEEMGFLTVQRDIVNLTKETIKSRLNNNIKLSEDVTSFILECLKPINERPTVEKLMESEFYLKYKEVNSEEIKIMLERAQVWDNITQILTKRIKNHSIDPESLELLLTKNEKEFLSLFDMCSQPIMDLLNLFKDAVKEYKNCLDTKIEENDMLFKECFLSVQLIRRLYDYANRAEKPLTFDLELAVLFGQLISEAPKYDRLINFIIITLKIMCFNASKQEMFLVMDTGCVEKILLFIEDDMVLSRLYNLQHDHKSVSIVCLNFLTLLGSCPRESIVRFLNNKGLDLLFNYLQVPELNLLITDTLMLLIGNLLVIIPEDVLPKIEEYFPIVLIYIQKKCRRTCSMMVNFLKKCDSLCFNTKLNLEYVNILLIEKICSWKLTEYARLSVSNVSVQLDNTLLFHLKAVQLFWLWVIANDVIAASQRDYHCHIIVENGAIEIMKTLLSDKRSTKRVNELAGLILSRIEQWQNGEDFSAIFKKAEEIDTCDINDAFANA